MSNHNEQNGRLSRFELLKQVVDGFTISVFAIFALTVLVIIPLFVFGPDFESRYYPVVKDFKILETYPHEESDPSITYYRVQFNKVRSCELIRGFEWYLIDNQGIQTRVLGQPSADPISRPVGANNIPRYEVSNGGQQFVSQKLVMSHRCHPFWTTYTVLNIPVGSDGQQKVK